MWLGNNTLILVMAWITYCSLFYYFYYFSFPFAESCWHDKERGISSGLMTQVSVGYDPRQHNLLQFQSLRQWSAQECIKSLRTPTLFFKSKEEGGEQSATASLHLELRNSTSISVMAWIPCCFCFPSAKSCWHGREVLRVPRDSSFGEGTYNP